VRGRADELAEAFTEIESSKNADRPQLARALDACRLTAGVLVVAKLDRLSRDAHFLLGLEKAGVEFVAADMPNANRLTVRLMAVIAQEEREMISARTKAALAAAKARVRSWAASVAARRLIQPRAEPRAVVRPTITPARLGR
jgi:DNA invertase Pin-like site-specific DNA recombinase